MRTASASNALMRLLEKQGIVPSLAWGYVAVTLFMIGDGIEVGFLSPYLDSRGFSDSSVALLWSVYGIVVAVSCWLAGALAESWGPKRVMLTGLWIWVILEVAFLFAISQENFTLMLVSFGIRGIGYPLFAYGFLVWVIMDTPDELMGKAVGWYWFSFTLGLGVISAYLAGALIPLVGPMAVLWTSLGFVLAGGLIAMFVLKGKAQEPVTLAGSLRGLVSSVTIVRRDHRIGYGGLLRIINTLSFYAFVAFLTTYMVRDVGFGLSEWQFIWGTMLLFNILANLASGYLADWLGRINVVIWGGCIGTMATILGMYYIPATFGAAFWPTMIIAVLYGIAVGMFVPLSAVVPLLASPRHRAAALAVLNLGAGLSQFFGPAIAALASTSAGAEGTVWVLAGISVVGVGLALTLRGGRRVDDEDFDAAPDAPAQDSVASRPARQPRV